MERDPWKDVWWYRTWSRRFIPKLFFFLLFVCQEDVDRWRIREIVGDWWPYHGGEVYLHIPWIGNISTKLEKQITSAVKRCFFSVEPRVVFTTRQLLPATKKDVLPSHHQNNVIYQFVCHCDGRYVGRTSQRLEERIKQHIPKSITNPPTPHIRQSLPHPGKATSPRQFHESSIGQRLLDNAECALYYNKDKFSLLARARTSFYLSVLEATFIKSLNPLLCKQKEFVYSLKIS